MVEGKTRLTFAALAQGTRLNDTYEIDAHIASGGMGEVYRGHNIETGEPVAIKTILPEFASNEAMFSLFRKEATLLGRLRHDSIVRYYSFSRDPASGVPYLAMEFVEGEALSQRISAGPLDGRAVATLFQRVAEGLAVAHAAGVIHRDLSPDNIILADGEVRQPRIIDFGIARNTDATDQTLIGSNFAGKFDFVSPEQLGMGNGEVTELSDVYSLALVMVATLRGKALDMGGTHVAVIEKRRSVPDLAGVDPSLLPLIQAMLAPAPADRPQGMTAVAEWLQSYLAGRSTSSIGAGAQAKVESPFGPADPGQAVRPANSTPPLAQSKAQRPRRSGAALAAGLAVLVLAGGAGAAYLAGLFDGQGETRVTASTPEAGPGTDAASADTEKVPAGEQPVPPASGVAAPTVEAAAPVAAEPAPQAAAAPAQTEPTPQAAAEAATAEPPAAEKPPTSSGPSGPGQAETAEQVAAATPPDTPAMAAPAAIPVAGDCFFATIAEVGDEKLAVRGLAPSQALFDTIGKSVVDAGSPIPAIDAAVVNAAQCAAVDFIEIVTPHAGPQTRLTLSTATPVGGATLFAEVAGAADRPVRFLAVDGDGVVRLLGSASKADANGSVKIAAPLDAEARQDLNLVIALAGDFAMPAPGGMASAFFPELAATLLNSKPEFGIDFAHFRPAAAQQAASFEPQPYTAGAIRPNHLSQEELDRALVDFYRDWKALYVVQDCGEGRYLLKVDADGKGAEGGSAPESITVSEAHGYGMLALALMAGADPQAQTAFDGMVHYRADHPANSSPHLMAWNQVKGCANAGEEQGGGNTATDGDLDIAYALLLADRMWGSAGAIDYRAQAVAMIAAILEHEVADDEVLLLGDWAARSDEKKFRDAMRISDFMPAHFQAFADASGEQRWLKVRDRGYTIVATITSKFAAKTGLMPDFIVDPDGKPRPAPANFMEGENDGDFSWNAARYPWRVSLDYLLYGEPRAGEAMRTLNQWVRDKVQENPDRLADTYRLNGSPAPGSGTGALTFVSLIGVAATVDAENQKWLNTIWDFVAAQKVADDDFYGNTLKLMAMIAMSGHWAKP